MSSKNPDVKKTIRLLFRKYPKAKCSLDYGSTIHLLVATILSAQCTDERVNKVTKELFRKYKTAKDFADVKQSVFEGEIRSTGFYRNKAKNIIAAAKMIVKDFNGKVPDNMSDLLKLPGVARKTANVVLGNAYNKNEGVVVDTHVSRISQRLGFTGEKNPVKIEKDLMKIVPKKNWTKFSHVLISHGRQTCIAQRHKCNECVVQKYCPYYNDVVKK